MSHLQQIRNYWHHVQIYKKATSLQHIGNRWLRGICSPAMGAKIYAKVFISLYAKMAKMCDFSNRTFAALCMTTVHLHGLEEQVQQAKQNFVQSFALYQNIWERLDS